MRPLLPIMCVSLLLAGPCTAYADGTDDAVLKANQGAYRIALNCFAAYGVNLGRFEKAGDKTNAEATEKHARASYDAAIKLGRVLGYDGGRVSMDFGLAQAREVPKLQSRAYFAETLGICKQVGL